jgi:hypothetical protein
MENDSLYADIRRHLSAQPTRMVLRHLEPDRDIKAWTHADPALAGHDVSPDETARSIIREIHEDADALGDSAMHKYGLFFWTEDCEPHHHRITIITRANGRAHAKAADR